MYVSMCVCIYVLAFIHNGFLYVFMRILHIFLICDINTADIRKSEKHPTPAWAYCSAFLSRSLTDPLYLYDSM